MKYLPESVADHILTIKEQYELAEFYKEHFDDMGPIIEPSEWEQHKAAWLQYPQEEN